MVWNLFPEGHPDLLHHSPRCQVLGVVNADEALDLELLEGELNGRLGTLSSESLTPIGAVDEPSNLGRGHEVGEPPGLSDTKPTYEFLFRLEIGRPNRESCLLPEVSIPGEPRASLRRGEDVPIRHVTHHFWVLLQPR